MALSRLAASLFAATALFAGAASAATQATGTSSAPAAATPAPTPTPAPTKDGDPGPHPCFWISQWQGWKALSPDVILLRISNRYIYKVVLSAGSPLIMAPDVHLISLVQNTSNICNAIDLQLSISDMHGFREGLITRSLTKLTDEEVKAIPSKDLPYKLLAKGDAGGRIRHRPAMTEDPFYRRVGETYQPTLASRGPWDASSLHGRVIIGLLAAIIEARHGGEEFLPARLTVDMFRLPGLDPAEVTTRLIKDGYRLKLVEAEFASGGRPAALATCQLLRRTANPAGTVWRLPTWDAPAPDQVADPGDPRAALSGMWQMRPIVGGMGTVGPRRIWMREVRPLIDGEALTPFVRAALAADFASPFANAGDAGLAYINSDATLYQHRPLAGEWIGMEVVNHEATDGVAIAECRLFDIDGAMGTASVAALAQSRGMNPP